ncbi:MAG: zinc-binding alcohol dehydrogenase family protein [Candidatus Aminicenantes bacterium]|nr:zinc-binding alcohol dehydrogenase family protein [Candidatus Aminicenantes bacterium]NIM77366.1 zinc-binding alcohol dehydrogenase family protein [Candidatus Aminicenantes bacterium]NIN16667.1 zinc-binding alcohol dehydrogenase family protein [Candidatus Aminicenantes bacterium]NIN40523.1 zinc-binding alcohol dehydrogenase family protein [Candidatus Aminicenantes bacterium]NIN83343.1 zinc-binding alcohol dehydrogenase family protein [Candidatus Aminicenantes bacterium]
MGKIKTLAWVLYEGEKNNHEESPVKKEVISFEVVTGKEVLAEPIYGGWEANMTHALQRKPLDVCRKRGESKVVLGNSGVVRVIKTGPGVTRVKEGDLCVFFGFSPTNRVNCLGYVDTFFAFGYDEPGTIGMLAKQTKLVEHQLFPIPRDSKIPLHQWPILSVRFATAWSNWKVASGCFRVQVSMEEYPSPYVVGWGGGAALGELLLAKEQSYKVAMTASTDKRLEYLKNLGITPVDRRAFPGLNYDPVKYESDREYRKKYLASLRIFRNVIDEITQGEDVSIFIENIGLVVYPATLRVLGRPGVIATSGWKEGMNLHINRALECHCRHIHVFTHGFGLAEARECFDYTNQNNWIPGDNTPIYDWEDIPQLAHDFANGKIDSYFPTFQVNPI